MCNASVGVVEEGVDTERVDFPRNDTWGLASAADDDAAVADSCAASDGRRRFMEAPDRPAGASLSGGSALLGAEETGVRIAGADEAPTAPGRDWLCKEGSEADEKNEGDVLGAFCALLGERDLRALYGLVACDWGVALDAFDGDGGKRDRDEGRVVPNP